MRKFLGHTALLLAAGALAAAGCATVSLPPVTDAPTGRHFTGQIIWRDLITATPDASKRFYAALFGWRFEEVGVPVGKTQIGYSLIRHEGRLIGGVVDARTLDRSDASSLSQWVISMSVDDIDAAVASVEADGGEILTPPTDVAARGTMALVKDSQGATLALLETRSGDPAQDAETPLGGFLWNEVWTDNVDAATHFYVDVANLQAIDWALPAGGSYRFLSAGRRPSFGVLPNPANGLAPTWVSYIRVADPDEITAQVPQLGGRVLAAAQERELGGRVALIAGPSGAGIAIQTWPPEQADVAFAAIGNQE